MSHDNYSLSARVYNHIRDGILAGTFAKGDELKEKNIGDELGGTDTGRCHQGAVQEIRTGQCPPPANRVPAHPPAAAYPVHLSVPTA